MDLVITRLEERRSHLANSGDPDVKLYEIRQNLYAMYDDVNLTCQNNDTEQIKKFVSDLESLTDQMQTTTNTLMAS